MQQLGVVSLGVLPGLQYTDFHKFLVSIGGLLTGAGFALPIFLLKSQTALLITNEQLGKATPEAAKAIRSQQGQVAFLVAAWPWLSLTLICAGSTLIFVGARAWKKQQQRIENREAAELSKIKAEGEKAQQETLALVQAQKATPQDIAEKREAEIEQPIDNGEAITQEDSAPNNGAPVSRTSPRETAIAFENNVLTRIAEHFGPAMELVTEVKLGPGSIADAVLVSKVAELPNILVEVRHVSKPGASRARSLVQDVAGWTLGSTGKAERLFGSGFTSLVIAGINGDEETVHQFRHAAAQEAASLGDYPKPLVLLVTSASNIKLSRIDAAPAASNGIHVM